LAKRLSTIPIGRIAILASAPEAEEVAQALGEHGIPWLALGPGELPRALRQGGLAGAIIGTEMLAGLDVGAIAALVEERASLAGATFILMVDRERPGELGDFQSKLGDPMLLERPLVPSFVVNCARAALHAHRRQLQVEEELQLREAAWERLGDATETLEERIVQRMRELASANEQLRRDAAKLRRLQAELIHISRVSAMGTMASTLAHELNQPLTAVSSYISGSRRLLSDPAGCQDQAHEALLAAEAAALRGGQILRRLREFVSRGHVAVKPEQLAILVAQACDLGFVDQHLLGVTYKVRLDPGCAWVAADRIQVQQVLINLFRNSVQAMQDSRHKEVVIGSAPAPGNMVEMSVADSGPGIAPEAREALFSPFQSTKPNGMGIGLSISRTIVEAHGGKIWAEEGAGGAVFRFTLPCAQAPGDPPGIG
jgi:C4-dicarboxylate-specific signal transduction histidine kinase